MRFSNVLDPGRVVEGFVCLGSLCPPSSVRRGYPVADRIGDNVYAILDAGHGFKMLAIGELAARELLSGRPEPLLEPLRMGRFAAGTVHPASKSPYPWT
jgi:hypothetical protein